MSLRPEFRFCEKCGNMYSWNPDVGRFDCPYCNKSLGKIHGTIEDDMLNEVFLIDPDVDKEKGERP